MRPGKAATRHLAVCFFLIKPSDNFHNAVEKLQIASAYQPVAGVIGGLKTSSFKFSLGVLIGESLINSHQPRICIIVGGNGAIGEGSSSECH